MSVATVRLNGLLSSASSNNMYPVLFRRNKIKLKTVLSKMALHIPEKSVAFLAINGVKVTKSDWVRDGDMIDIFPKVSGG